MYTIYYAQIKRAGIRTVFTTDSLKLEFLPKTIIYDRANSQTADNLLLQYLYFMVGLTFY